MLASITEQYRIFLGKGGKTSSTGALVLQENSLREGDGRRQNRCYRVGQSPMQSNGLLVKRENSLNGRADYGRGKVSHL